MTTHADAEFWNRFFRQRRESGNDLDWKGLWTEPFLVTLQEAGTRTILELGCGTGNDAARLAGEGYSVTAIDLSDDAIGQARAKFGSQARFLVADMTQPLPFPSGDFAEWRNLELTAVAVPHRQSGEPYKQVWRGIARR